MATRTDVLLVTANVGSLFDNVGEIQNEWLQELYKTIRTCQPQFIALHFQEVGGKEYMVNMGQAEEFFWNIESSDELKDFDRRCIYVDNQFQAEERFTALGSMYFIHKSLKNIRQYDFSVKDFKAVPGLDKFVGSLDGVTTMEKEKFPKNFWPDFKWSRKGFMRTRWIIHDRGLDLVNVHLFHDASNLIACKTSPSVYSANRKNALRHVINRISDNCHNTTPFFLFGDFNFRLDTLSLVQHLSTSAEVQTVKKDRSNEVQKIICEEKADRQVLLLIEDKLFAYLHQAVFRDDNGRALLKYDKEVTAFHDVVREEEITFPPSYPYSEEYTKPTQYMNTRCPAWCDRILMSHAAQQFIHSGADGEKSVVYDTVGPNVCMGDHKPVFLFFALKTNVH
ncbi:inositol polyphosphate-5-phosphatase A isoform X2 [Phycodurus eques]|uniref:inositol polyphosphate-5-phosphatase A isoform X2 n=1 Tax=Phycodurus eques TaxID=693459 RepID=UPI002ACEB64F|nr:inositol polyphosphate-5-phosphatase A isoform X2 [Phycodurus eques]XP_061527478.1 inositol polyphosphate-5-phosphatase A isoform X2 [Phycodurus eques]XP_061527479.1 inositol polyphosphate-5-phosphatase A isoform X2 [Phycodurus eques]XP_061527481.1 inositol polyphosphate-5-phosphatase A isoform X2 [Phycodurus eques]